MQLKEISPGLVIQTVGTNMRPTMELMFLAGKLHQKWINDDATASEWRKVPSEL